MKNLIYSLLFSILIIPELIQATHYMGGEITWECMTGSKYTTYQQGRYRFHMKLYRECGGITYGTTQTLYTSVPGLASITMTQIGIPKDISPKCYSENLSIKCATAILSIAGAMSEYNYTSDATYPNGVQLNGIPPATGWMFYYEDCCRNPCTNITNSTSLGYRLRAIMYPYNNQNTYPCFDNSPTFSEKPKPVMCSGYPTIYNHNAIDADGDSLHFEWGEPLEDGGFGISGYTSGYNYLHPFPDTTFNANNIPATINPQTGEIGLTSFTSGAFVTVTKVTSYKNGVKISEIWRDVQLVLLNCGINCLSDFRFLDSSVTTLVKNVTYGDIINLYLIGNNSQQISRFAFWAMGDEFGNFIPASSGNVAIYDTIGCPKLPCAYLSNAGTYQNQIVDSTQNGFITNFRWKTSLNHIPAGSSNASYSFIFNGINDTCPIPVSKPIKLIVNISAPYIITIAPKIISTEVLNSNGSLKINYQIPNDPDTAFNQYEFYYSTTKNGVYTFAGSGNMYSKNFFLHINPDVLNKEVYYYMRVKDVKNGTTQYSLNSDTVSTRFVDLSVESVYYTHQTNGMMDVMMTVWNKGNFPISNFNLRYDVINGSTANQFITDTVLPGTSMEYNFPTVYSNDTGTVSICGSVLHSKDFNVGNNMFCYQAYTNIESLFKNRFTLSQSIPNPTKGNSSFNFQTPVSGDLTISVQNVLGETLFSNKLKVGQGSHRYDLDISDFNAGVYFYSIEMLGYKQTKRIILLK